MHEFSSNYSPVSENHSLVLNNSYVTAVRHQARLILLPFFQKIAITERENDDGKIFPILTSLAERIINKVYQDGELGQILEEKSRKIAIPFVTGLRNWEKECLAFYFFSGESFLDKLEDEDGRTYFEETPDELEAQEVGKIIIHCVNQLISNEENLARYIIRELIHLQDIFSTEDIGSWDASSITNANENFETYAGPGIKFIPLPIDEYEYWEGILESGEEEKDEEDDEEDEEDYEEDEEDDNEHNPFR